MTKSIIPLIVILLISSSSKAENNTELDQFVDQGYQTSRIFLNQTCEIISVEYYFPTGFQCSSDYFEAIFQLSDPDFSPLGKTDNDYKSTMNLALTLSAIHLRNHNPISTWGGEVEKKPIDLNFELTE